jgi:3-oxoacyl-(acyl-carrier-protein) synthase
MADAVITGIGLVTPLGCTAGEVVDRILRGEKALRPLPFASPCPSFAFVPDFDAAGFFPDNKTLRLMNRDAQMAVVAARLAMQDSGVVPGTLYPAEEIALYGATGLSGMPPAEIGSLLETAAGPDGLLDLERFGRVALRRIRPVLSFKILANMPICFVSIFESLRGPNAVYTPWEGNGAQAIAAGMRAVIEGEVPCAVVGGCDVKTHELSFLSLRQLGLFDSWTQHGCGIVPGEGAAFLVLEKREQAERRGAPIYAIVREEAFGSVAADTPLTDVFAGILGRLQTSQGCHCWLAQPCDGPAEVALPDKPAVAPVLASMQAPAKTPRSIRVVAATDGNPTFAEAERAALEQSGLGQAERICPKAHLGNLFAAAAAVQVAMAAAWAARESGGTRVLADCFGPGTEQGAFLLEGV